MNFTEQAPKNETPSRGPSLGDQIYTWMAKAIIAGSYAPRERITIRRLAEELGASVTPVREAVVRLVADGVLETTEKSAVVVPERTETEIQEIFEVRKTLEGDMAFAAASRISESDIDLLKSVQNDFLVALSRSDYREVLRLNSVFHFIIYKLSEMPLRQKIAETLWLRIGPTLRYMYPLLHEQRGNHRRHENIIEAATSRDAEALRTAILDDLNSSQAALYRHMQNNKEGPKRRIRPTLSDR